MMMMMVMVMTMMVMMMKKKKREKKRWPREVGLSAMNILLTPGNTGQEY